MSGRRRGDCHVIGLVVTTFIKPHRDIMLGWMRYGHDRGDVELRFFFASMATTAANLQSFAGSGVDALVLCGLKDDVAIEFIRSGHGDVPVVVCVHTPLNGMDLALHPHVGGVLVDGEAIGRHVGEFFLAHGLENFAFLRANFNRERLYGSIRCAAFRSVVMADGGDGRTFSENTFGTCCANGDFWDPPREEILPWVKALPLPCGVFVNGDRSASVLVDACHRLGIDIPGQIEVVSVNNSHGICESVGATISSIQPDFDECARQSIDLALKMIGGASDLTVEERTIVVSSHTLVERSSSLSGRSHGKIVTRAREFIKHNACRGISVVDVVKHVGVSRRTLEMRVKYATGSSILGLIRNVRLKNICRLLETTNLALSEVIMQSGYSLTGNAEAFFKKTYGMTMRQYRKSHIAQ